MEKRRRRWIAVPLAICVIALGLLGRSQALAHVRAVDALLLFVAGVSVGAALTAVLRPRSP